jgi:hypothetical protein
MSAATRARSSAPIPWVSVGRYEVNSSLGAAMFVLCAARFAAMSSAPNEVGFVRESVQPMCWSSET